MIKYGFYNSSGGDRKYNASDFSKLFSGVINDGIFMSIGDHFTVTAAGGNNISVGTGKAWFNDTWIENDSIITLNCGASDTLYNRIDAIVIEINVSDRKNDIKHIKGTPAITPTNPTLSVGDGLYRYPLCYIYRPRSNSDISQANITDMVGSTETPFVTGILQTVSLDERLGQWRAQLNTFISEGQTRLNTFISEGNKFISEEQNRIATMINEFQAFKENEYDKWETEQKATVAGLVSDTEDLLSRLWDALDTTVAGSLQNQIIKLEKTTSSNKDSINDNEIKDILLNGFIDGRKSFSDDGRYIESISSDGRLLQKIIDGNIITTVLYNEDHEEVARLIKKITGTSVNLTFTYNEEGGIQNG